MRQRSGFFKVFCICVVGSWTNEGFQHTDERMMDLETICDGVSINRYVFVKWMFRTVRPSERYNDICHRGEWVCDGYSAIHRGFSTACGRSCTRCCQRADLTQQLESLKADIQEFNELTAPSIAEDLHAQIIEKNKVLSEEIQTYLQQMKMDNFDAAAILEDQQGLMKQLQQSVSLCKILNN